MGNVTGVPVGENGREEILEKIMVKWFPKPREGIKPHIQKDQWIPSR